MFVRMRNLLSGLIIGLALASCGGGGGQLAEGGIGGTGISTGSVTGFGSVWVNGVKFSTADSTIVINDTSIQSIDETTASSLLSKGMVVIVEGSVNPDGVSGTADNVIFSHLLEGPATRGVLNNTFTALGQNIITDGKTLTTGGVVFDISTISDGDIVEVSGYYDANGDIRATFIEETISTTYEVKGKVTGIGADNFNINGLTVVPPSMAGISSGQFVEAKGTSYDNGTMTLTADEVSSAFESFDINRANYVELEGIAQSPCVLDINSECEFTLNGQIVLVTPSTVFEAGTALQIQAGVQLEVEGTPDSNGRINAEEVEFEDDIEIIAEIESVTPGTGKKVVTLVGLSGVQVEIFEESTELDGIDYITEIVAGTHIDVRGRIQSGTIVAATRVELGSSADAKLQGPLEVFEPPPGIPSVTVLGVTEFTAGLDYLVDDVITDEATFYNTVMLNNIIKLKGDFDGANITWTKVELDL